MATSRREERDAGGVQLRRIDLAEFEALAPQWDALAADRSGPYLSSAWLTAWWRGFASDDGFALVLTDGGRLLAGGCFRELRDGAVLGSASNAHTGSWDLVAANVESAQRFWEKALAESSYRRIRLDAVAGDGYRDAACDAMAAAGFRLAEEELPPSPWMELPDSFDDLLRARSKKLRSEIGRRRRVLQREGTLVLRTTTGGPGLEADLERFFELEASGWKGRAGTAIALDPSLRALYTDFARAASDAGWLRLYLLELDDRTIGAAFGCALRGCGYLIKSAFDEKQAQFGPGFLLRAEVLRESIEEGLNRYDFLGAPDSYKRRWTDEVRRQSTLRAFRGVRAAGAYAWWASLRPALKSARDAARRRGWLRNDRRASR